MNVPITPGTLLQDRYFVLRVLRPIEFGWMYRAVDQQNHGTVCLLEEFIIPDRVADRTAILQQKFTLEMQRFEVHRSAEVATDELRGLPGFMETIVEQNRVFIVQSWGDHASYDQVLEDRVLSGEGAAELEETEAVELLDGLEPLLRSLARMGLVHGYLCRDTIVWLDEYHCPGLMHFGQIRSIALQYELDAVNEIASVNDGQNDLQQLSTAVLELLGDRPWNRISIDLAHRLRLLLEPEHRSQLRLQVMPQVTPQVMPQTSVSGSQKLPAYASFAVAASIHPSASPRSHHPDALSRRRVKKRIPKQSLFQSLLRSLVRSLVRSIALVVRTLKNDPSLGVMAAVAIGLCGILGHRLISAQPSPSAPPSTTTVPSSGFKLPDSNAVTTAELAPTEVALPAGIETKLRSLNVSSEWFSATVTELTGNVTGNTAAPQGSQWQDRATLLLKILEALPPESRRDIGNYRRANLDTWLIAAQPAAKLETLSKQIDDATDAEFFKAFPDRKGTALNPRNLGQVWYAIARTETAKLKR